MRIYVCGPMSNLPELNYPAFNQAATQLRAEGHEVINPAENEDGSGRTWIDFMRISIRQILGVECLYLLPNWETSKGARIEVLIAGFLGHDFLGQWSPYNPPRLDRNAVIRTALIHSLYHHEVR